MSRQVNRRPKIKAGSNWDLVGPSAEAVKSLWEQDLDLPDRPNVAIPLLPPDPTELDDSALMSLFSVLTGWLIYTGARLAASEVDEKFAVERLDLIEKRILIENSGAKRVSDAKAMFQASEDYVAAKAKVMQTYAFRKMLGCIYSATDEKNKLISRELTRRVGRDPREQRNGKWNP
jgi:hypothetical protein